MTKFEANRELIEMISLCGGQFAVEKESGKVAICSQTDCDDCLMKERAGEKFTPMYCSKLRLEWCMEEDDSRSENPCCEECGNFGRFPVSRDMGICHSKRKIVGAEQKCCGHRRNI